MVLRPFTSLSRAALTALLLTSSTAWAQEEEDTRDLREVEEEVNQIKVRVLEAGETLESLKAVPLTSRRGRTLLEVHYLHDLPRDYRVDAVSITFDDMSLVQDTGPWHRGREVDSERLMVPEGLHTLQVSLQLRGPMGDPFTVESAYEIEVEDALTTDVHITAWRQRGFFMQFEYRPRIRWEISTE